MERGSQVRFMTFETYYRSMASWYGHEYTRFSELDGHRVPHDKDQMYHSLNVNLLDDAITAASSGC